MNPKYQEIKRAMEQTPIDPIIEAIGWQDIASAPKDGTPILIWQPSSQKHVWADGVDDQRYAIGYWRTWEPGGGWGNRNDSTVVPTHWQPLPAPPPTMKAER
jgi:hypothetical protein